MNKLTPEQRLGLEEIARASGCNDPATCLQNALTWWLFLRLPAREAVAQMIRESRGGWDHFEAANYCMRQMFLRENLDESVLNAIYADMQEPGRSFIQASNELMREGLHHRIHGSELTPNCKSTEFPSQHR